MESEGPETRRRSRSKTPSTLRKSVDRDAGDGEKKTVRKNPTVVTISEEETPSLDELGDNVIVRVTRQSTKIITSDYSSDDGVESAAQDDVQVQKPPTPPPKLTRIVATNGGQLTSSFTTTKITVTKSSTIESSGSNSETKSSVTTQSNEVNQSKNDVSKFLATASLRTSTPKAKVVTKKSSLEQTNGERSDSSSNGHIAYREYSEAGEYWNKVPKTDYTYSKLSPHRRELADGFVSMPNMSRSSVSRHEERVTHMVRSHPDQESYIRQRYQHLNVGSFGEKSDYRNFLMSEDNTARSANSFEYDSQDEVDVAQFERRRAAYSSHVVRQHQETLVRRVFVTIITMLYSFWHNVTRVFSRSEHNLYYTRLEGEKSWFRKVTSWFSTATLSLFRYFYLFISSILYLDCWLLQSRTSNNRKKRFLLFLLILWPFLLLGAWLLADNNQRNIILSYLPLTVTTTAASSTLFSLPLTTLSTVKQYIPDWNAKFPDLDFNLDWLRTQPARSERLTSSGAGSAPVSSQYNKLDDSVKGALGTAEYAKLLAHIERYIDRMAADKLQQHHQKVESERLQQSSSRFSDEIADHITQQVRNSFTVYKYELSDSDCDRIAAKVRAQIEIYVDNKFGLLANEQSEKRPFIFTDDNIEEIQKVINQSFETKNYQLKVEAAAAGGDGVAVNWEGVLEKVLKSSHLSEFVDGKLTVALKANEAKLGRLNELFEELRAEVKGLRAADSASGQADLVASMHALQAKQENLANQFVELRAAQDKRLELILNEMNLKLAKHSEQQFLRLDDKVRGIVLEILGYEMGEEGVTGDLDIKNWIKSVFVAREYLEVRLHQVNNQSDHRLQDEMQKSAGVIMQEVSNKIKREVLTVVDAERKDLPKSVNLHGGLGEEDVRRIVREALALYDADKTGLVDYALESAGGQVLSTRCTESYQAKSAQISVFGIPLWYPSNTPRTAITPNVQPGQCWAFQGFPGFLVIQLNKEIYVTGFTMEHIPKSLSPNGKIDSAPNNFSVWGLRNENDIEPVLFGKYQFLDSDNSLQYFPVQNTAIDQAYRVVELRIESNLGNMMYTCLYRFRVHGQPK